MLYPLPLFPLPPSSFIPFLHRVCSSPSPSSPAPLLFTIHGPARTPLAPFSTSLSLSLSLPPFRPRRPTFLYMVNSGLVGFAPGPMDLVRDRPALDAGNSALVRALRLERSRACAGLMRGCEACALTTPVGVMFGQFRAWAGLTQRQFRACRPYARTVRRPYALAIPAL